MPVELLPREAALFRAINNWPDSWSKILWPVMQLGNGLMAVGAPLAVALVGGSRRRQAVASLTAFGAWQSAKGVKRAVKRGRPRAYFDDVRLRDGDPTGDGFVSGHATVAFASASILAPVLPTWLTAPCWAAAATVATARVYVGAHLPADVLGGAVLGLIIGRVGAAVAE